MMRLAAAPPAPAKPFDAIVIGGSAGSIEALAVLLPALP
ncbi:chemotaxis protein CheB, partial [Vibrio cholerae]|nr:chemotaxis protein CheB [Vibrio cholerae]